MNHVKLVVIFLYVLISVNSYSQKLKYTVDDTILVKQYIDSAAFYVKNAKKDIALKYINNAISIQESIFGKDHSTLVSLYDLKAYNILSIDKIKAIDLYQNCIRITKLTYGESDWRQRQFINYIAYAYASSSDYERALKTLKSYVNPFPNESNYKDYTYTLQRIADYHLKLNEVDSAIHFYLKDLSIINKVRDLDTIKLKRIVNNFLAKAYLQNGEFEKSELIKTNFELMVPPDFFKNMDIKDTLQLIEKYGILADISQRREEYYKSIEYYQLIIELQQKYKTLDSKSLANAFKYLGGFYYLVNDHKNACESYKKGLSLCLDNKIDDKRFIMDFYDRIGYSKFMLGLNNESLEYYWQALSIKNQIDSISVETAISYRSVANVYSNLGEFDKADTYFDKSLKICLKKNNLNNLNLIYSDLAQLEFRIQNYEKARYYIDKSFDICGYSYSSNTIPKFIQIVISNLDLLGQIQLKKYHKYKDISFLDSAIISYNKAIALIDIGREQRNEYFKESYFYNYRNIYIRAIQASILVSVDSALLSNIENAFNIIEKTKSIGLLESVKKTQALQFSGIPDSILTIEKNLNSTVASINKLLFSTTEENKSKNYINNLTFDESRLKEKYNLFQKELEAKYPQYYNLKKVKGSVDIKKLRSELKINNSGILSYFIGDSSIFIFVLTAQKLIVKEVKKDFDLTNSVNGFLRSIVGFKTDPILSDSYDSLCKVYCNLGSDLYKRLIKPVEYELPNYLIIIPDGILGYLPFEALLVEPPEYIGRYEKYNYFMKKHKISYSYSSNMLLEMSNRTNVNNWNTDFSGFAPFYKEDTLNLENIFAFSDYVRKDLSPLPFSGEEVFKISKLFNGKHYVSKSATKDNFNRACLNSKILHLATHAQANDKMGDFCFLVFSESNDSINKGILYAREIYNMKLNAELVTLSACETGIGEIKKGEGIISLARAFAYAGAKSIVTSLWQISDSKTKDLMIDFYKYLKKGVPKDEALWHAKMEYLSRNKGEAASPFYWAAFIGIGDMKSLN